jgi:hypothetical protein
MLEGWAIKIAQGERGGAQEASEPVSLAMIEQGLCKRDADDPAAANIFHSPSFDRLFWSVHSPVK